MLYNGGVYAHKTFNQSGKTNSSVSDVFTYADTVYRSLSKVLSSTYSFVDTTSRSLAKVIADTFHFADIAEGLAIISDNLRQTVIDTFHFSDSFSISGTLNHISRLPQVLLAHARTIGGFVAIVKPQGVSQAKKPKGV